MKDQIDYEAEGRLFIRRVKQALQDDGNDAEESQAKVEEMRDLMKTFTRMLKHSIGQIKQLEEDKELLTHENNVATDILAKLDTYMHKAEGSLSNFATKFKEFDAMKYKLDMMKEDYIERNRCKDTSRIEGKGDVKEEPKITKSRKTQTTTSVNECVKYSAKESSCEDGYYTSGEIVGGTIDTSLQRLQSIFLQRELKWHQTSGREREQRVKIGRLVKQMKTLQNQLDWKNNQLDFKDAEVKEKTLKLSDAEKKIAELKKMLQTSGKRSKTHQSTTKFSL